ncbi:MAG: hypothetical protein ABIM64_01675 [candidate division WOR-3 bacterium]
MVARKYLIVRKDGVIVKHKLSGKRKRDYEKVGYSRKKAVYKLKSLAIQPMSKKYRFRKLRVEKKIPKKEFKKEYVGFVGAVYDNPAHYFHAEMLFSYYTDKKIDESKLIFSAYEIFLEALTNLDRVNYSLVSTLKRDLNRFAIVRVSEYDGHELDWIDCSIYIPSYSSMKSPVMRFGTNLVI